MRPALHLGMKDGAAALLPRILIESRTYPYREFEEELR